VAFFKGVKRRKKISRTTFIRPPLKKSGAGHELTAMASNVLNNLL